MEDIHLPHAEAEPAQPGMAQVEGQLPSASIDHCQPGLSACGDAVITMGRCFGNSGCIMLLVSDKTRTSLSNASAGRISPVVDHAAKSVPFS